MSTSDESLKETGRCAAASLVEMVAALECDYDRLEELRELESGKHLDGPEIDELKDLEEAAGECTSREEAETRITEDALEVAVRSDWYQPGLIDHGDPQDFLILLSTGGPASRICAMNFTAYGRAELDARLEGLDDIPRHNMPGPRAAIVRPHARYL